MFFNRTGSMKSWGGSVDGVKKPVPGAGEIVSVKLKGGKYAICVGDGKSNVSKLPCVFLEKTMSELESDGVIPGGYNPICYGDEEGGGGDEGGISGGGGHYAED